MARAGSESVVFDQVYKAFVASNNEAILALEEVSFNVADGEFVSLVGPSGCGKSTCLNIIAGLTGTSAGEVWYRGEQVSGINTKVGYITQDDNLFPWRTLQANVEFALEVRGVSKRERRQRALEQIESVGLRGFENHYPHQLSGGMRKRAGIVRTLVYDSPVVLMDEPFGPLDAQTRVILQDELLKLWEKSRPSVLFVTHDLVEAIAMSDRIIVFTSRPGQIKSIYDVDLPRPRDVFRIHEVPGFAELHDALWRDIRAEIEAAGLTREGATT
jgi:NitT/TauT family transport system ATP-binding protein